MNDLNVAPSFFCSEFQMEGINNCWVHALKFSLNFLLINLSLCPKKSVELSDWEEMGHFWETLFGRLHKKTFSSSLVRLHYFFLN